MSPKRKGDSASTMLELWRPPRDAGDPIGCLATTYTFSPGLFDEQCLARFLSIESEPDREDLSFLLERETRLGSVYAGVLVDHTQAGVEHSLRWDVLPVRIRAGKQHAKISLLAWSHCVRIIVASANLTEPGYRSNFEVAGFIELRPDSADLPTAAEAIDFLRDLLQLVPGASGDQAAVTRASAFLVQIEKLTANWERPGHGSVVRQSLVFNLPAQAPATDSRSALRTAIEECRRRGRSPTEVWVASPFFDLDEQTNRVTAELCKSMARGSSRSLELFVPAAEETGKSTIPRLAAPKALLTTPEQYGTQVEIGTLPRLDSDSNPRAWHAKIYRFEAEKYSALMIGSSNLTCAGLGVGGAANAEANLLTIVDRAPFRREIGALQSIWPELTLLDDPENAEWLGAQPERDEETQAEKPPLHPGFLSAIYRAGDSRAIVLRLNPANMPPEWTIAAVGIGKTVVLDSDRWERRGRPAELEVRWVPVQPPEKLRVTWGDSEAFWALNVLDGRHLPPPARLEEMTADDMLGILAATDPSAAFRAWAKVRGAAESFDADLDSAVPVDLDPLRLYDLQATFLHRIRRRARVLAQLRANLERPVWGRQALEWRLRGLIGVEALGQRLLRELLTNEGKRDEALLTLADFLIVLREVEYRPVEGALDRRQFEAIYRPFLGELAATLGGSVRSISSLSEAAPEAILEFWQRVEALCHA